METFTFQFNGVTERDMDLLFLEEIVSSKGFAELFLSKVGIKNAQVIGIEHSKTDVEWGESDITVVFAVGNRKHALLIEDKIDAMAMPRQCERYFERGNKGKENGDYDSFDVFIIAPEKYLSQNTEATKYPNQVTYEECAAFFESRHDARSVFKFQQISQAIQKKQNGYQVIEHKAVTEFWDKYISYQEKHYRNLWLLSKRGIRGFNARWPQYSTVIKGVGIDHKSEVGFVDMTLPGCADKIVFLEREILNSSLDLSEQGMTIERTGKAAAIRKVVPKLDFAKPFENYAADIPTCFEAIEELTELAKKISLHENIVKLING